MAEAAYTVPATIQVSARGIDYVADPPIKLENGGSVSVRVLAEDERGTPTQAEFVVTPAPDRLRTPANRSTKPFSTPLDTSGEGTG